MPRANALASWSAHQANVTATCRSDTAQVNDQIRSPPYEGLLDMDHLCKGVLVFSPTPSHSLTNAPLEVAT